MSKTKSANVMPLVVTTKHRGVFFGYGKPTDAETIKMSSVRMCVFWDASLRGVLGLASSGPGPNCKITPSVKAMTIRDVTAVMECTDEAAASWEKAPWK